MRTEDYLFRYDRGAFWLAQVRRIHRIQSDPESLLDPPPSQPNQKQPAQASSSHNGAPFLQRLSSGWLYPLASRFPVARLLSRWLFSSSAALFLLLRQVRGYVELVAMPSFDIYMSGTRPTQPNARTKLDTT